MVNEEIRCAMKAANVKQWQIADALGIHEKTFCVWLRHELPADKKKEILDVIEKLKKKGE